MWNSVLDAHLEELRKGLLDNWELWPLIVKRTKLSKATLVGFARNYKDFRNPRLETVTSLANALEALKTQLYAGL